MTEKAILEKNEILMDKKGTIFRPEFIVIAIALFVFVLIFVNKYEDLENKVIVLQEKDIIKNLASALHFQYMQHRTNGIYNSRGTAWPLENPFSFLSTTPDYIKYSEKPEPDARTWRFQGPLRVKKWGYGYYIYCPHFSEKLRKGDRFFYTAWDPQGRYEGQINLDLSYHKH